MNPHHNSGYNHVPARPVLTRRTLLNLTTDISALSVLNACSSSTEPETGTNTTTQQADTPTASTSSSTAAAGASSEASAHPTFAKGYSGGSKAPAGEYRPADAQGPAQNVPKPKKPEDIGLETPEALFHFIEYWNELRNYALQTGDVQTYADYTAEGYEEVEKFCNYTKHLYDKGGWMVGGLQKITYDPNTLRSPSDHVYVLVGQVKANDLVIFDNEQYKTFTYRRAELGEDVLEFGIVFKSSGHWSFAGTEKLDVNN